VLHLKTCFALLTMAFHYIRSKAQRPSTVEYSDVAPVAATSSSPSVSVGLSVAAVG